MFNWNDMEIVNLRKTGALFGMMAEMRQRRVDRIEIKVTPNLHLMWLGYSKSKNGPLM